MIEQDLVPSGATASELLKNVAAYHDLRRCCFEINANESKGEFFLSVVQISGGSTVILGQASQPYRDKDALKAEIAEARHLWPNPADKS